MANSRSCCSVLMASKRQSSNRVCLVLLLHGDLPHGNFLEAHLRLNAQRHPLDAGLLRLSRPWRILEAFLRSSRHGKGGPPIGFALSLRSMANSRSSSSATARKGAGAVLICWGACSMQDSRCSSSSMPLGGRGRIGQWYSGCSKL